MEKLLLLPDRNGLNSALPFHGKKIEGIYGLAGQLDPSCGSNLRDAGRGIAFLGQISLEKRSSFFFKMS